MAGRIVGTVVLRHPTSGDIVALVAGDECPDWAAGLITNPNVLEPEPEPEPQVDDGDEGEEGGESSDEESSDEESSDGNEGEAQGKPEPPQAPKRSTSTRKQ